MRVFLIVLFTSFIMSFNTNAGENGNMIRNQVMSILNNKQNVWTPTDFAMARGDVSSVSKIQISKDIIRKSGIRFPNILNTILVWVK